MATATRSQRRTSRTPASDAPATPTKQSFDKDFIISADYSGPITRSVARRRTGLTSAPTSVPTRQFRRNQKNATHTRSTSNSSVDSINDDASSASHDEVDTASSSTSPVRNKDDKLSIKNDNDKSGRILAPASPSSWSRTPSPAGLIPIHEKWHAFVHKHEVPRKALHVSIGFFSLWLYVTGTQPTSVTPWLMAGLIPITITDILRHNVPAFNTIYVKVLGALMRESEFQGYNGVIFYLLGAWIVLHFFPKDIGLLGVMLLSWCDTAASTIGRAYGRYTPKVRYGKSLAGSLAAMVTGIFTALYFWGYLTPKIGYQPGDENFPFMFTGRLGLPGAMENALGLSPGQSVISGNWALGIMSVFTGIIASASEVVDLWGWDDNLTIPVLSGLGIWGFLKVFGY